MQHQHSAVDMIDTTGDINVVEKWIQVDKTRWAAGLLAGAFAGVVALVFAMIFSKAVGLELTFPAKLMATPILGAAAANYDAGLGAILTGFIFFELIAVFWGIVYAHFTYTNSLPALMGMGLTWAAFSWIFIFNLFMQSWEPIFAAAIPSGAAFAVCLVYGLALTSVAAFDRAIRGNK